MNEVVFHSRNRSLHAFTHYMCTLNPSTDHRFFLLRDEPLSSREIIERLGGDVERIEINFNLGTAPVDVTGYYTKGEPYCDSEADID